MLPRQRGPEVPNSGSPGQAATEEAAPGLRILCERLRAPAGRPRRHCRTPSEAMGDFEIETAKMLPDAPVRKVLLALRHGGRGEIVRATGSVNGVSPLFERARRTVRRPGVPLPIVHLQH